MRFKSPIAIVLSNVLLQKIIKGLRYFLAAKSPLTKTDEGHTKAYISIYNEVFLNTKSAVFDRNRFHMGLGYQLNEQIRLEV